MPKAIKGEELPTIENLTRILNVTIPGVLVQCDPSIKAIILKIDQEKHDYIVEDLDDQTLVIKETQLSNLKRRLDEVSVVLDLLPTPLTMITRR